MAGVDFAIYLLSFRGSPGLDLPAHSSEGFDAEPFLRPFPTWCVGSVKCSKSSVNCSLIGLGTEFVGRSRSSTRGAFGARTTVRSAVVPVFLVNNRTLKRGSELLIDIRKGYLQLYSFLWSWSTLGFGGIFDTLPKPSFNTSL